METVYSHNITAQEVNYIGILDKPLYLKVVDIDSANKDLARLFYLRGEINKAMEFADKLPPLMRNDFLRSITHP